MDKHPRISVVNDANEAKAQVKLWLLQGHSREHIYILSHDDARTDWAAEYVDVQQIGAAEEGIIGTITNMFRSQGDSLRAKLTSLHVTPEEAERLEQEMDEGKIVLLAAD